MTFINELIPEEEKEKLTFYHEIDSIRKPKLWKWTIDRDIDAFNLLINKSGGAYEGTTLSRTYILCWKQKLIHYTTEQVFNTEEKHITWNIYKLDIPEDLKNNKEKIFKLIKNALETEGYLWDKKFVDSVTVNFTPDMWLTVAGIPANA